jgi:peptidoglycan hydrolase-like protein with peptidoglycan-binding domain
VLTWIVVCVIIATGAYFLGGLIRSPWDDAVANSRASPLVTSEVVLRDFSPSVAEVDGVASVGVAIEVAPTSVGGAKMVVSKEYAVAGDMLAPGDVIVEVSGRPILAVPLPFPLYRDLVPGDTGSDVEAMQASLKAAGIYEGRVDGVYGPGTSAAVRGMYKRAGVSAPLPSDEAAQALQGAVEALELGRAGLESSSPLGPGSGASPDTDGDLRRLRDDVARARAAADTPLPMTEVQAMPAGGAEVVSVLPVGTVLGDEQASVARLRSDVPRITARVGIKDLPAYTQDASVVVEPATRAGKKSPAKVVAVSEFRPAGESSDLPGHDVTVVFDDESHEPFTEGERVVVTPADSPGTVKGMAVPLVALRHEGEVTFVVVKKGDSTDRVEVDIVETSDGFALVESSQLGIGDHVVVGGTS